jgi:hypothetical protein
MKCFGRVRYNQVSLHTLFSVPIAGMGHGDAGGEELDQPDVDGQPGQEDPLRRGSEAPLDLRKSNLSNLTDLSDEFTKKNGPNRKK